MTSDERLFEVDPVVPLVREPRGQVPGSRDARFRNDYPLDWDHCGTCDGWVPHAYVPSAVEDWEFCDVKGCTRSRMEHYGWKRVPRCPDCLGMGSLKARVRLEAGHRCERCGHPYVPKADADKLGVEPSFWSGGWSVCDRLCTHGGPVRYRASSAQDWIETAEALALAEAEADVEVQAQWRVLTVHHLDGDKANCRWWNLAVLCQRCHLEIQAKVVMERVYPHEHTEWFKPHAAGYYAWVYLEEELSREETLERLDELLELELGVT